MKKFDGQRSLVRAEGCRRSGTWLSRPAVIGRAAGPSVCCLAVLSIRSQQLARRSCSLGPLGLHRSGASSPTTSTYPVRLARGRDPRSTMPSVALGIRERGRQTEVRPGSHGKDCHCWIKREPASERCRAPQLRGQGMYCGWIELRLLRTEYGYGLRTTDCCHVDATQHPRNHAEHLIAAARAGDDKQQASRPRLCILVRVQGPRRSCPRALPPSWSWTHCGAELGTTNRPTIDLSLEWHWWTGG